MRGVLTSTDEGGPTCLQRTTDTRWGIDLHRCRSVIVRMTRDGERLGSVRIDNDPLGLAAEIAKAGESPQVVLEATYGWYWAVDVLREAGAEVHLVHPLGVRFLPIGGVKNDARDAADLADLLRIGRLRRAGSPRRRCGSCASWSAAAPSWSRGAAR